MCDVKVREGGACKQGVAKCGVRHVAAAQGEGLQRVVRHAAAAQQARISSACACARARAFVRAYTTPLPGLESRRSCFRAGQFASVAVSVDCSIGTLHSDSERKARQRSSVCAARVHCTEAVSSAAGQQRASAHRHHVQRQALQRGRRRRHSLHHRPRELASGGVPVRQRQLRIAQPGQLLAGGITETPAAHGGQVAQVGASA